jgi:predicted nucleotidyltransferase
MAALDKATILLRLQDAAPRLSAFGVRRIGLFGSSLQGAVREGGDIDLLVDLTEQGERYAEFLALCGFLETLFPEARVDVVTRGGLSPHLGPRILQSVEYVQVAA